MTTLIVASHPDDEVLGCGGTVSRLSDEGEEVHVVILGEGATSRADSRAAAGEAGVQNLREASMQAAEILGAASVRHVGLPDNRFDELALLDIVKAVERAIDELLPRTVFVQHGGDVNIDHQRTFQATLAATRPQPGHPVKELYAFEVASSTEWAFQVLAPAFQPSMYVDISDHLGRKLDAMRVYASELREAPHPRSLQRLQIQAQHVGAVVGVDAAEAFQLIRQLR